MLKANREWKYIFDMFHGRLRAFSKYSLSVELLNKKSIGICFYLWSMSFFELPVERYVIKKRERND